MVTASQHGTCLLEMRHQDLCLPFLIGAPRPNNTLNRLCKNCRARVKDFGASWSKSRYFRRPLPKPFTPTTREQDSARRAGGGLEAPSYFKSVEGLGNVDSSLVRFGKSSSVYEKSTRRERRFYRISDFSSSFSSFSFFLNRRERFQKVDTQIYRAIWLKKKQAESGTKYSVERSFLDRLEFTGISGVNCPQGPC